MNFMLNFIVKMYGESRDKRPALRGVHSGYGQADAVAISTDTWYPRGKLLPGSIFQTGNPAAYWVMSACHCL
jgi:hypothetical protein